MAGNLNKQRFLALIFVDLSRNMNITGLILSFLAAIAAGIINAIAGLIGGRLAGKLKPELLRWMVVFIGLVVATAYFFR